MSLNCCPAAATLTLWEPPIPLRSDLFLASRELQACLASDAAHVAPGARGQHVALIQSALVRLDVLDADAARIEARTYGPRTAAAVLTYKREFNIVNRAYQNSADNIVGRMTISSLDHGIAALDDRLGGPRLAARPGPHPQSPTAAAGLVAPGRQAGLANSFGVTSTRVATVTGSGAFGPPLLNGQTIGHLRTVGPWLADQARKLNLF